jgi:hypothetical protein
MSLFIRFRVNTNMIIKSCNSSSIENITISNKYGIYEKYIIFSVYSNNKHWGLNSYTSSVQQLHNTPSHGGGPHTLGPTPCEGVLCNCCSGVVNPSFSINIIVFTNLNIKRKIRSIGIFYQYLLSIN